MRIVQSGGITILKFLAIEFSFFDNGKKRPEESERSPGAPPAPPVVKKCAACAARANTVVVLSGRCLGDQMRTRARAHVRAVPSPPISSIASVRSGRNLSERGRDACTLITRTVAGDCII
jgi:hypothetical protein